MPLTVSQLLERAKAGLPLILPQSSRTSFPRQPAAGNAGARNKFYYKPAEDNGTEEWIERQKRAAQAVKNDRPPRSFQAPPIRKPARIRPQPANLEYKDEVKLVYRPRFEEDDPLQEAPIGWSFVGFRFDIRDGEWWFYSERRDQSNTVRENWTRHLRGQPPTYRSLSPVLEGGVRPALPEWHEESYGDTAELGKRLAHCMPLVIHLLRLRAYAEMELSAKGG